MHFSRAARSWLACLQVPLVASNRIGEEKMDSGSITFYGGSFIAGPTGEIREQVSPSLPPYSAVNNFACSFVCHADLSTHTFFLAHDECIVGMATMEVWGYLVVSTGTVECRLARRQKGS